MVLTFKLNTFDGKSQHLEQKEAIDFASDRSQQPEPSFENQSIWRQLHPDFAWESEQDDILFTGVRVPHFSPLKSRKPVQFNFYRTQMKKVVIIAVTYSVIPQHSGS
eukprot:13428_1